MTPRRPTIAVVVIAQFLCDHWPRRVNDFLKVDNSGRVGEYVVAYVLCPLLEVSSMKAINVPV